MLPCSQLITLAQQLPGGPGGCGAVAACVRPPALAYVCFGRPRGLVQTAQPVQPAPPASLAHSFACTHQPCVPSGHCPRASRTPRAPPPRCYVGKRHARARVAECLAQMPLAHTNALRNTLLIHLNAPRNTRRHGQGRAAAAGAQRLPRGARARGGPGRLHRRCQGKRGDAAPCGRQQGGACSSAWPWHPHKKKTPRCAYFCCDNRRRRPRTRRARRQRRRRQWRLPLRARPLVARLLMAQALQAWVLRARPPAVQPLMAQVQALAAWVRHPQGPQLRARPHRVWQQVGWGWECSCLRPRLHGWCRPIAAARTWHAGMGMRCAHFLITQAL